MNGLLILSGGGDEKQALKIDTALRQEIIYKGSVRVLYVPLGLENEYFKSAVNWFTANYNYFDHIDVVMNKSDALQFMQREYDLIYLGGGNTGKLLYELRDYGLDKFILNHINRGGIVYGGSAGAIIFGKTITIAPKDEYEISNNNNGFNLLGGNSLVPHFQGSFSKHHTDEAEKYHSGLIGIAESSGIICRNGKILKRFNSEGIQLLQKG